MKNRATAPNWIAALAALFLAPLAEASLTRPTLPTYEPPAFPPPTLALLAPSPELSFAPSPFPLFSGNEISLALKNRLTTDDRFLYKWSWRGELVSVTVKPTWPDGASNPYAGQQIRYDYDAVGRLLSRTHVGELPSNETDDTKRPFIEKRRYLWDGSTLLSETAYAQDRTDGSEGPLRWRKSYVPGASGLDDAVEVRVETYDGAGVGVLTEKLYSYLRDEQGTVTGIVEEKAGGDPAKPPVLVRYLYDPYGQAHAELGEELYRATYDKSLKSVTPPSGGTATQTPTATAVSGALTLLFSEPIDLTTLTGLAVERRLTDGTWGALTASDLAIGRDPALSEGLVILPLNGWEKSASYRIRLTSALLATDGRGLPGTMTLQIEVPDSGDLIYDIPFPILYDSAFASGNDLKGAFPGGSSALYQGLWTDPVTGIAFARARWYDARNASFLQEDPAEDLDSSSLYAFVGLRPNEATDPMGLFGWSDVTDFAKDFVSETAMSFGADQRTARNIGNFTVSAAESFGKTVAVIGAVGVVSGLCPPCGLALGTAILTKGVVTATENRLGQGQNPLQAVAGAATDMTGVSDLYAGLANKDLITQQDLGLTDYERAGRAGSGLGSAMGFRAAAKSYKAGKGLGELGREAVTDIASDLRARFDAPRESSGPSPSTRPEGAVQRVMDQLPCRCFAAGTLVATEQGEKPIEAIEPGDRVVAYDPATATTAFDEVQAGFLRLADRSVVVTVAGEQIQTTEEHPFFVVGKDWVRAEQLQAGDRLLTITGKWLPVERIDIRETPMAVFNLMVAEAHTYYAGKSQVLVHNECPLMNLARPKVGGEVNWNNGWRTANGKFASPRGPGRSGAMAEQSVWDAIKQKRGWNVREGRVSVRDASGTLRVYDGAAISPRGRVIGLEIKSGTARRTASQRMFDRWLNSNSGNTASGVGVNLGLTIQRSLEIRVP
ncbi:MAG: polymorphic toxin-type HINT domain-containing protein [Acidobacteriota bacterium]